MAGASLGVLRAKDGLLTILLRILSQLDLSPKLMTLIILTLTHIRSTYQMRIGFLESFARFLAVAFESGSEILSHPFLKN